jgi:hypothetical protein
MGNSKQVVILKSRDLVKKSIHKRHCLVVTDVVVVRGYEASDPKLLCIVRKKNSPRLVERECNYLPQELTFLAGGC